MKLHDRIAQARELFSGSSDGAILDRRPAAPGAGSEPQPAPEEKVAHHQGHIDRRTAMSTRTLANHHQHHKAD